MRAALRQLYRVFNNTSPASSRPSPSFFAASQRASLPASMSVAAGLVAVPVAMASTSYSASVSAPQLGPCVDEVRSRPHHLKKANGTTTGFRNVYPSAGTMFHTWTFFKGFFAARRAGELVAPDVTPPTVEVRKPEFLSARWGSRALRATWLGHACYYVEYPSGLRVLFDPVFEDRCSPLSFFGPVRYTAPPCQLKNLPFVDAVIISHSHYDHLSLPSVREIATHYPDAHFFVGLGLKKWFHGAGIQKVTEMDWWETVELTMTRKSDQPTDKTDADSTASARQEVIKAQIGCLPAQHSSGRTLTDRESTLWCSWSVTSSGGPAPEPKSVWFGGDTGYRAVPKVPQGDPAAEWEPPYDNLPVCPQFEQIGKLRGPFDLGLIPIGAYKPRWLFSHMHANPYDAVEIFRDTRCKRAMGIHWGTWVLTAEDVLEPPRQLKAALKRRGMEETGLFDVCEIGESREF